MEILLVLIPISIGLAGFWLLSFFWSVRNKQYDDPEGARYRILRDDYDDHPAED
ncbi:MAG: cbb3-type cytochrome oxidase biogenesis heme b insertase CcoS [Rhodobacteraceae bacterium HLUCCA08]|nr:MAG: cbb3-type cytochrome oxidase biogenesis heme b insertase CcoS [Rhodobacteraceae bacterium HLUCCA08]